MKDIYEILKKLGIEMADDKKKDFETSFFANYKTVEEMNNMKSKLEKAEGERDTYKGKYDTDIKQRDEDLKKLKKQLEDAGADSETVEKLKTQLSDLQTSYDDAKTKYDAELKKQAYEYAVKEKTNNIKFSSNSAKKAFLSDVINSNLTMKDGEVLGFDDFVNKYKEQDAGAFLTDEPKEDKPGEKVDKPFFSGKASGSKSQETDSGKDGKQENKERPLIW